MRPLLLSAALLLIACSDPVQPASGISGTWAQDGKVPGSSLVLTVSQSGTTLSGAGTYSIEAGRSGTLTVSGSYVAPQVTLSLTYDSAVHTSFTGTVIGSDILRGSYDGVSGTVTFTRQP